MTAVTTFADLARVIQAQERADNERTRAERLERKRKTQSKAVVGGVYRREPIDRTAAMMLARAPWWAYAPSVRVTVKQEDAKMPEKTMYAQRSAGSDPKLNPSGDMINLDELAARLADKIEKGVPKELRALAECAVNARGMLDDAIKGIGASMDEFERITRAAGQTVRAHRMTTVSESSSVVNALKDVRQFFLGPDYEREQKRLAEFVDLCERMKTLKDSGFLDTVADTMIRLAADDK